MKSDFAIGAKTTFSLFDKSVGEFMCAKLYKMAKGIKSDWFVDYIILTTPYNNKCYTLPCYRWLTDDNAIITLREGTGGGNGYSYKYKQTFLSRKIKINNFDSRKKS